MRESGESTNGKDNALAPHATSGVTSHLPSSPIEFLRGATGPGAIDTPTSPPPIKQAAERSPELRLIYETAPIGLAFLTPDCRYLQINRHLTEICGISIADHIGRSVRDTVPQVADQVEHIVQTVLRTGKTISGVEINGQRADGGNAERVWITHWHPLKAEDGNILGINVVAEEITERKRAEAVLAASEIRLRELADNMSQFAWTADALGWIYWYNKRWHDYTGTTLEEMQGWGWQKVHHPDHVDRVVNRIRQSFETGTPWEDIFPLRGRDGTYRWFLSRALPIRNEAGDVVRWFGTNTDVTAQIEAETALRESEVRFRELANNISQFAWTADQAGWIYWYNERWHDYAGTTLEEMQGWGWQKVHHPDHVDRVVNRIRQSFETGTAWEDTFPLRGRDGTYRWFLSRALPIRNEAGDVIRWFGTNTDVTEQIDAEKALRESEVRFRELANNISQFAWTADQAGWIYWYNERWHDYTGTTLEEMQGWGWQKVHHPDHVDRVVNRIRQSFETGTPWEDTFPLLSRDGTYRWFLSRALPIRNEAGDVVRWFGTNTDVTAQIEAETALRNLNETLEQRVEAEARERAQIWNVSQDLLLVTDMSGKFVSVNPAWTTMLGWSESDLLGKTSEWLLHPDDRAKTQVQLTRLAEGRATRHFESRYRHARGSYYWLSWRAATDKGHIYAVGRDITDIKIAEEQLRASRRELATVSRQSMMGAMTASIAHEVNQPLGSIVANANAGLRWLARAEPDLEEARATLKRIIDDGHRAGAVITGIRSMFGKDHREKSPVSVNDLVGDVLALVRRELENRGVSLQNEMLHELPQVIAERVQLQQVFLNLIMNAVEAMSSVTDRQRVLTIRSRIVESDRVQITLEDSGTGIDSSDIDRIFEPFFTTKSDGMGMGLSICRSIIESHDGRLSAAPRHPYGSAFQVVLPIVVPGGKP